jgi:hypothetical protein
MLPRKTGRPVLTATALIFTMAVMLAVSGCSIKKPESPSWISTWDVPISNKTYGIMDLLEKLDDSLFVIDSLGNPAFSISYDLDTVSVDNSLTFNGTTIDFVDSIGAVDIPSPSDQYAFTNINDFLPVTLGVVPPTYFTYSQQIPLISEYSWMEIQSGLLDLQFYNGLEVDLDTFVVTIIDESDMHVVGVATYIDGLNYLETETQTIDISGQTISNSLSVNYDGYTSGGVLLYAGPQNLDITISFPGNIIVTAAQAETPEISIAQSVGTALTDSTLVVSAEIATGDLQFDISNYTQIPFSLDIQSSNFSNSGVPLQVSRNINPGVTQVNVDLAGYTFAPDDSVSGQYVNVDCSAIAPPSAPAQYVIDAADSVAIHVAVSNITFASITGQIKPTDVAIDPVQQDVNFPEGFDQARLTQAVLNLNLYNNSMVDADISLTISGGGNFIDISDRIFGKSSPSDPAELTILTVGSQQLADFLDPPPSQITVSGNAVMNPDYGIATISSSDSFYGDIEIYSPLALAIDNAISIDLDINETTIDPGSRPNNYSETFKYGAIDVEFESHLPLGLSLTMYIGLLPDSTLYSDPNTLVLGPYTLQPGVTDSNGHVIESVISNIADSLDSNEIAIFDNDTLYYGQMINLMPTDPNGVQVLGQDYINIKSNARIQIQVGDNIWDNL